jgi:hypothetical protein
LYSRLHSESDEVSRAKHDHLLYSGDFFWHIARHARA